MTKKKTVEEVRELFESRGFTLLSKDYQDSKTPLNYLCSNGHQSKISFNSFHEGRGCAKCGGKKKKTLEEVKNKFESRGFTLLSKEYKNCMSPLEYLCSNGHQTKICFSMLQSGHGCAECSGNKKKTIEEVRELFKSRGFTLLSNDYSNNNSPLEYICDQGHQTNTCFSSLQNGKGCADCGGTKKKTIEDARKLFDSKGYTLVSTEYINVLSPLVYICSNAHTSKIRFADLQTGYGCASCANHGFNPNKPAILYYLRFQYEGNLYYKIGITNRTISERFSLEKIPYTVIKETAYTMGQDAHTQEQAILKKFSAYRYKGKPFLKDGNTELFTRDVLQLDYSILMTAC